MFSAPAIPYLHIPELVLIPKALYKGFPPVDFSIKPFGALVATGVYVGAVLATRLAKRLGFHERAMTSFMVWVAVAGFLSAHMLDVIFYYPGQVLEDPLSLLRLWEGLSSFGGFSGAIIGGFLWKWRYKADILPYSDVVASAFPVGWVFGRTGCSIAHDHPGLASDAWFAVQYPDGGRFDLGLYEMLLTIPLALAFLWLRKKPRPWGFYLGAMMIAYAPVRFALDFLRVAEPIAERGGLVAAVDPRYAGLTPAQWACFGLLLLGVYFFAHTLNSAGSPAAFAAPPLPAALGGRAGGAAVTRES
ncbi:MAG TPA: prolipoprotein diacylglyceryl transferase family protein [Polyangiaceae bacterium]|nr:prolipoprotein diacylglyceryl transferase family protein [Polyangiaceae bacterium]